MVKDFIAEVLPQKDANCNLCDITYSLAFKKGEWKKYIASLNIESEFFFKDVFLKKFNIEADYDTSFPNAYLQQEDESLHEIISSKEMNDLETLDELMKLVSDRIGDFPN